MPVELRDFFEHFGIDIAVPVETWTVEGDIHQKRCKYCAYYAVKGSVVTNGKDSFKIGEVTICVKTLGFSIPLKEPYFWLTAYPIELPWVIEESIVEVYS